MTDYVFETDLLIDGPRQRRNIVWAGDTDPPAGDVRPMLLPCTRTWTDNEGAVRFSLPLGEPIVERHPGCTVIGRIRREVALSGNSRATRVRAALPIVSRVSSLNNMPATVAAVDAESSGG